MARVAIVLSGCGFYDGSEINESVLTHLHLRKKGVEVVFVAPDIEQTHTIDHLTGQEDEEANRNVLRESARIARSEIKSLYEISAMDIDAVIFPGGFGAAKNLSDYAFRESMDDMACQLYVDSLVKDMHAAGKPQGFICVSPIAVAAIALRGKGLKLTLGKDTGTQGIRDMHSENTPYSKLRALGHMHIDTEADQIVVDDYNKVVSTPAYMTATDITQVDAGISKLVEAVLAMVQTEVHVDEAGTVANVPEDVAL